MTTPDPQEIERQEECPAYQCAECGAPVVLHDGNYFRECDHAGVAILANMEAIVYGKSKVN